MIYILVIIFLFAIMSWLGTGMDNTLTANTQDGQVVAREMMIYHSAASRACSTDTCAVGTIDAAAEIPAIYKSETGNAYTNGTFTSVHFATGGSDYIVTYLVKKPANGARVQAYYGQVLAGLSSVASWDSVNYLGAYDVGKGELPSRGSANWYDPRTGQVIVSTADTALKVTLPGVTAAVPAIASVIGPS